MRWEVEYVFGYIQEEYCWYEKVYNEENDPCDPYSVAYDECECDPDFCMGLGGGGGHDSGNTVELIPIDLEGTQIHDYEKSLRTMATGLRKLGERKASCSPSI